MKQIEWYIVVSNQQENKDIVLTRNEITYPQNISIAKKSNKSWLYSKFTSIHKFIECYTTCNMKERRFYAILTHKTRYLHLDIDYKLNTKLSLNEHKLLVSTIKKSLNKFVAIYGRQFGVKYKCIIWIFWTALDCIMIKNIL